MKLILLPSPESQALQNYYRRALDQSVELYIVSAYLTHWEDRHPLNNGCKTFRLIVGKDFGITRKQACLNVLKWLPGNRRGQFLVADAIDGFHPKAMFWRESDGRAYSVIGSSNLSKAAFSSNHEVNAFSEIRDTDFQAAKKWVKRIEAHSVPVSEAWLEQYNEANQTPRQTNSKGGGSTPVIELDLPRPIHQIKLKQILSGRRNQMRTFQRKKAALERLFREAADHKGSWRATDNEAFYDRLNLLWTFGDGGSRFQGAGWERQGKGSNFRQFSRSLVRVLDAPDDDRDDIVTEEVDRLAREKVATRGALFSEMLCQFFPNRYHVLNKPVKDWLDSTRFSPPRRATEGTRYVDCARKLRIALLRAVGHPAKNLAELDAVIWLSQQP